MKTESRSKRSVSMVVAVALCVALPAAASTYFGFTIGVSNAPPPPRVVLVERPDFVAVPGTLVYAIGNTDYDLFRYQGAYYLYNDGYWYRAHRTSGPFVVVDVRSVPRSILRVPPGHWKHGGPPGLMRGGPPGQMRGGPPGRGRGHGGH